MLITMSKNEKKTIYPIKGIQLILTTSCRRNQKSGIIFKKRRQPAEQERYL